MHILSIEICLVGLGLALLFVYNWKRRWLYYYSSKIPGPFSVPILGTIELAFAGKERMFDVVDETVNKYQEIFKAWVGSQLYVVVSIPEHVEYVLNTCLRKDNVSFYDSVEENISSIFSSKVDIWKTHRKTMNPAFNQKILNSSMDTVVKYSNALSNELEGHCCDEYMDILQPVWRCTLNSLLESMYDVDPRPFISKNYTFMHLATRLDELLLERSCNVLFHFNLFWKLSWYNKECKLIAKELCEYIRKILDVNKQSRQLTTSYSISDDDLTDRKLLNRLYSSQDFTEKEREEEALVMLIAGSEISARILATFLLVMSIHPEIQDKIYEEQCSIFADDRDVELSDINRMDFLERVIKETLRHYAPSRYIARYTDQNVVMDSYTIPAGSRILIPVWKIHQNPEYWPDPLKFDPDRFLPEEVEKRPRGSYLAFSSGPRNCIGFAYGMMSMKAILSTILRRYKVKPGKYKSTQEIIVEFRFVGKVKDGYEVKLEKRLQCNK